MGGNLLMEELALPVEGLFLDRINVADQEDAEERQHASEDQAAAFEEHFLVHHCPRVEEDHLYVEQDEQHRDQVKLHRHPRGAGALGQHAAFVGRILHLIGVRPLADELGNNEISGGKSYGHTKQDQHRQILCELTLHPLFVRGAPSGVQRKPFVACVFPRNFHDAPPVEPLDKNSEEDQLTLFMEWLLANRTQVVLIIIIALGIGMIVYVKKVNAVLAEETAAEDLLAASTGDSQVTFQADSVNPDQSLSDRLNSVVQNHKGTQAADIAGFLAASALYDERKYAEAAKAFEAFQGTEAGRGKLAAAVQFGLAAALDASGDTDRAKEHYKKVKNEHDKTAEAIQARVALAKLILAQAEPDKAAAKELLVEASQESQAGRIPGFWGSEAERLLAPLNVATPESSEAPQEEAPESNEE